MKTIQDRSLVHGMSSVLHYSHVGYDIDRSDSSMVEIRSVEPECTERDNLEKLIINELGNEENEFLVTEQLIDIIPRSIDTVLNMFP